MRLAYFAGDGNYGMENGNFVLVDVSDWTDEDWQKVEEADDYQRPRVANEIAWGHAHRPMFEDVPNE